MSYKVEELLALRGSVSESAVSLDKFVDGDAIKEHVLRPSASATLAAASSDRSLRSSLTPALAPAAPNKKPSPSPSIKRGKAERLLKEHGSPPGMRVTAGGRVVPSDLPPLNNRFANNTFKPPSLRGVPVGNTMPVQPRLDANNVPRLEVVGSQPVLYLGDRAYALPALDAPSSSIPSFAPSGLDATAKPVNQPLTIPAQDGFISAPLNPPRVNTQTPVAGLDLQTLRGQQALKRQELRAVEQTEVLQASHQPDSWRASMIEKKRSLIIELDGLRKQISTLEATDNNVPPVHSNGASGQASLTTTQIAPSAFVPQFQQPVPSPMFGYPSTTPYPPMMMYQPAFGGFPNMPATEPTAFVQNPIQPPHSPGSASRRSHAIEIKPPREDNKKQVTSMLDPKSPTYEPPAKTTSIKSVLPAPPSPAKRSPWRQNDLSQADKREEREITRKLSLSSIDTADFFPTNAHEHSSTRIAPKVPESKQLSNENAVVPSTPEKIWPASPWNEGNSSRSSSKAVTKLTSWPEAFGKQPSIPSLKLAATTPTTTNNQERGHLSAAAEQLKSALAGNVASRKAPEQRQGTEETWPPLNSRPIHHVPSTYQEGYQAGYDHVGIPDSPEVLKGYIQGLLQFIADESKKGRNNSLRGLVAGSTPHDSAVSVSFDRTDAVIGGQENARSVKGLPAMEPRRASGYGVQDMPVTYSFCNEAVQEPRMRNPSAAMYLSALDASDKCAVAHKSATLSATGNDSGKQIPDKAMMSRTDSALSSGCYPRQISGNQLSSRTYGTPASMQRFFPVPKEYGSTKSTADMPSSGRPTQRMSGLDGAMDDLAGIVLDTGIEEQRPSTEGQYSTGFAGSRESIEGDASCFRPSSSKGKQKLTSSPTKSAPSERTGVAASSPANTSGSPKKSGEHSPAKAKLEQVTNKFRRAKKDDPRTMSPEEKKQRSQKWRSRFQRIRQEELKEVQEYIEKKPRD